jgi:DNA-binding transcriptional MerR regulator
MENAHPFVKTPLLSVVANAGDNPPLVSRSEAAARLGVSVATVRRYEGTLLHPHVDKDGTHRFDAKEVTALAASRANQAIDRGAIRNAKPATEPRTRGEIAALVFERFEQRQSHAEVVIGLHIEPETVRELFDQWCLGLTESQLRKRAPNLPLEEDIERVHRGELEKRLAALPDGEVTRSCVIHSMRSRGHVSRESVLCPQCDSKIELDHGPRTTRDGSGDIVEPQVIAIRCQVCVAWIRIEGWSGWSATHYSMTQCQDASAALASFPRGIWFAVADVEVPN